MACDYMTKRYPFEIRMLLKAKTQLNKAIEIQQCPACRHDMEQLSLFLKEKIKSEISSTAMNEKTLKILKNLGFIKELTNFGIPVVKFIGLFAELGRFTVPAAYDHILSDNLKANRQIKIYLLNMRKAISKINHKDGQLVEVHNILKYFIRATDFKLNASPQTFYLFDRMIRFGYNTGILSMVSKIITGTKQAVSCCME